METRMRPGARLNAFRLTRRPTASLACCSGEGSLRNFGTGDQWQPRRRSQRPTVVWWTRTRRAASQRCSSATVAPASYRASSSCVWRSRREGARRRRRRARVSAFRYATSAVASNSGLSWRRGKRSVIGQAAGAACRQWWRSRGSAWMYRKPCAGVKSNKVVIYQHDKINLRASLGASRRVLPLCGAGGVALAARAGMVSGRRCRGASRSMRRAIARKAARTPSRRPA